MNNAFKMKALLAGVICLITVPQLCFAGASAHAASGRWFVKAADSDSSSVWFGSFTWAQTANINWTLPTFTADGAPVPTVPVPFTEPKYTIAAGWPSARTFTGYNVTGTGAKGSTATSSGFGSSSVGAIFYGADWTVNASGSGTYDVKAVANDPWDIFTSDLSSITNTTYSLYIPFSMLGGSGASTSSGFGYGVTYTTASGTTTLLDVAVGATGAVATVTSAFGSMLELYLVPNSTTAPVDATTPGTQISASELQNILLGDINTNGNLTTPINLGIVLNGITIPTQAFGADGAVAQVGVTAYAYASDVPEPCALAILSVVGAGFFVRRRYKQIRLVHKLRHRHNKNDN